MKTIKIAVSTDGGWTYEHKVKAVVRGDWAAHKIEGIPGKDTPQPSEGHGWRVTHVPTGFSIASTCDDLMPQDAIRIAAALNENVPDFPKEWAHEDAIGLTEWKYIAHAVIAEALAEAA